MKENRVAQALQVIGCAIIAIGALGSVFIAAEWSGIIGFASFLGCVFQGVLFIGFAEVIDLLEKNVNNSAKIISKVSSGKKDIDASQLPEL